MGCSSFGQEWLRHLQGSDVWCAGLLKDSGVSCGDWSGIFLEMKGMRYFLCLYTCT